MSNKKQLDMSPYLDDELEIFESSRLINRKHIYSQDSQQTKKGSGLKSCGKARYKDREQAKKALFLIRSKIESGIYSGSKRQENRSYFCSGCHAWHLSSKIDISAVEVSIASAA